MTYHKSNYTKPTWKTYVRHKWQGQFIGFHFLIALFKEATEFTFLISTGTSSQVLGARWDNVLEPKIPDFIGLERNLILYASSCVIRGIIIEWKDFFHYLWWKPIHYFIQLSGKDLNISVVYWNGILSF